jgi:hypothetical protein
MMYSDEMGSGAMTHIRSFTKIGSGFLNLIGDVHRYIQICIHTDTQTAWRSHKPIFIF